MAISAGLVDAPLLPPLLLHVPNDTFVRPRDETLYPSVIELLKKAGEIAQDTGRAYLYPCHLALAILSMGDFTRPDMPVNFQARLKLYLSDLLEEAGGSLDTFRRALWKDAVRLPIQEGYCSDELYDSIDLIKFLRQSCLRHQYYGSSHLYLEHLLKAIIQHESLSPAMKYYPVPVKEIVMVLQRFESRAAALENKIDSSWAEDLTAAEEAHHSPTIGRWDEIKRIIHILSCRTKNMPLLVGKSGVGKTTIARILARWILEGRVPQHLSASVISLTSSGKDNLWDVISHIKSAQSNGKHYILFIDDIHELQKSDVPRLKRYLKAGKLHCIGTTTPRHYDETIKLYGSSDYLSDIQVDEPSVPETVNILRTLTDSLTIYHGGKFSVEDAALYQAVNMAKRFLASTVALPKSAVQILDQACALVRNQRSQTFESWEYVQSRKVVLQVEIAALKNQSDPASLMRLHAASTEFISVEEQCSAFQNALTIEYKNRRLCRHLIFLHNDAQTSGDKFLEHDIRYGAIPDFEDRWTKITSPVKVTANVVAKVVSDATGFPVDKLKATEQDKVLNLDAELAEQVVGQPEATKAVADAIQLAYSGLIDPNRPVASFLLVGPTGTGKTLLAKTLAKVLFDSSEAMVRIDASEYSEKHSVARLVSHVYLEHGCLPQTCLHQIGSPPGYVGYQKGGQLTSHVRQNPYTIILIDEIEKAAAEFVMIFLQVLDDGRLTDGLGETVVLSLRFPHIMLRLFTVTLLYRIFATLSSS
ncbi:hypothetical protein PILCRDRAFT_815192 [Piloderma croceum F 1598]|uniref:AAA+ ATPase domain-containing protein n=1 Tax=Piloderma croceum (strain F 1598) TaxID=765440 RepID=A0A0C3CD65_PILCF|nr:hypothetical protein PILCRDRAFT_815192 [Piloderma croceum F 1598]